MGCSLGCCVCHLEKGLVLVVRQVCNIAEVEHKGVRSPSQKEFDLRGATTGSVKKYRGTGPERVGGVSVVLLEVSLGETVCSLGKTAEMGSDEFSMQKKS